VAAYHEYTNVACKLVRLQNAMANGVDYDAQADMEGKEYAKMIEQDFKQHMRITLKGG
jgi:hypothetical protein